ncbi:MAG: hypothetical protein Q4F85_16720 [Prevotella sp.]|nr:hypothetical protein [Prevotella sp.]
MRNKFLLVVMMLFMATGNTLKAQGAVAKAVYCEGNKTLYFLNSINVGDTHNEQTVTKVWGYVTNTSTTPHGMIINQV